MSRKRSLLAIGLSAALVGLPAAAEPDGSLRVSEVRFVDAVASGPPVAARLAEIRRRIQEALVYPPLALRLGVTGITRIRFQIGSDGRATGLEAADSSGSPVLDRAALRAARDAGVLPRVYGRLELPIRFALGD